MRCAKYLLALLVFAVFGRGTSYAQTLIINEVSNGPSGNMEYVEFVVIDTAIVYNCVATTPPCIDIRGWIFDDNNGYHGATGVAAGAIRFANNPLWSCVPVGTIIVIYNNSDPNTSMPAVDVSLNDGNCVIVAPVVSVYFDRNTTTPGAIACSYPAAGWVNSGDWTTTALANSGDCARIVDLSGCEVFSLCYGSANTNTLIYFNSGGSGADNVWYMNGSDPYVQANWSEGCADPSTCGVNDQTPGAPNNALNAAYIGQFNNNCLPITPLTATATPFNSACGCNATIDGSASGSIGPYSYSWYDANFVSLNTTTSTITGLCPGTYHLIVESAIACFDTVTVAVTSPVIIDPQLSTNPVSCFGGNNGSASVNPSGGLGPYTVSWSPAPAVGQGTNNASGFSAGAHSVTITDQAGCQVTDNFTITQPTLLTLSAPVTAQPSCNGSCNGSISVTASGGTSPYSFAWSNGQSGSTATALCAGTYTVTVSDNQGCTRTASAVITDPAALNLNLSSTNAVCGTNNGTASAIVSGGTVSASYSFIWFDDFFNILPSTASLSGLTPGNYTVVVGDDNGCSVSGMVTILQPGAPVLSETHLNVSCNQANDASIDLTVNGIPPYTFSWTGPSFVSSNEDINALGPGTYSVSVLDSGACPVSLSITISEPLAIQPILILNNETCPGTNDGQITANASGGTSPYSYSLNGGAYSSTNIFSGLAPGNYTLSIQDDQGCTKDSLITIAPAASLSATMNIVDAGCFGECNGSANLTINGNGPFQISWNGAPAVGITSVSSLCAGTVDAQISDASGCSISISNTITEFPEVFFTSVTMFNDSCHGECQGEIVITAPGISSFSIDGGTTFAPNGSFSGLCANTYSLVIADANGCLADSLVSISEPGPLTINAGNDQQICSGTSATLTASAGGGTAPYSFAWSASELNAGITVSPTTDTTLCVQVTDANGCTISPDCALISITPALAVNAGSDTSICEGNAVTLSSQISGGSGAAVNYAWSDGTSVISSSNSVLVSPTQTTTYYLLATETCGSAQDSIVVTVDSIPSLQIIADQISGCSPLVVNFSDPNATPGANCVWTFGTAGSNDDCVSTSFTFANPGCYDISYSLTSLNGCTTSVIETAMVCVIADPVAAFTPTTSTVSAFNNSVELNNTSTGATEFVWSLNNQSFSTAFNSQVTIPAESASQQQICLLATNDEGCFDSTCAIIEVIPELAIYVPNAFTPNTGSLNELFGPVVTGNVDEYHFMIFDRWGELIFESFTPGVLWDGTYKGIKSQIDTYVWTLMVYVDDPGKEYKFKGHVTLIR